jgi:two-component system response regulator HydG
MGKINEGQSRAVSDRVLKIIKSHRKRIQVKLKWFMTFQPKILYVDDDLPQLDLFKQEFGADYEVRTCPSGQEALEMIEKEGEQFALLIVGQRMPGLTGVEVCERAAHLQPQMIRMVLTAYTSPKFLLQAINRGHVHDFILKPWKKENLKPILDKAFEEYKKKMARVHELQKQAAKIDSLEKEIREIYDSEAIIGESSGLKQNMEIIKKAAPTDSTILILGETGTGKELLARAIHDRSLRKSGPFIPVHCASLVKTLMESELFGHEKGSFTGADRLHIGRFESAKGGTIFLDEIGELTEEIQVKLLRVLQEKEIFRVGGNRPIPVDIRLISATHRNLGEMIRTGKFREDLFYRLNVISLKVPPLRDRKEDIPLLASHFLKKCCQNSYKNLSFSPETLEYLANYDWPGNIRELQNTIERAVILCEGSTIEPEDLNLNIDQALRVDHVDMSKMSTNGSIKSKIQGEEMQKLSEVLTQTKGNVTEAARLMGIPRTTLFNRLRKYHLI